MNVVYSTVLLHRRYDTDLAPPEDEGNEEVDRENED